jgi:hypothetical protein
MPDGAGGRIRTDTVSLPTDFESVTSANSITPACFQLCKYSTLHRERQAERIRGKIRDCGAKKAANTGKKFAEKGRCTFCIVVRLMGLKMHKDYYNYTTDG